VVPQRSKSFRKNEKISKKSRISLKIRKNWRGSKKITKFGEKKDVDFWGKKSENLEQN